MNSTPNYKLPCLPTPQEYLRGKRQTILNRYVKMSKKAIVLEYKFHTMLGLAKDLKLKYEEIDYQLAEIDGRLKREEKAKARTKVKAKININKETSIGLTSDQIARIASVLNIEIGGN